MLDYAQEVPRIAAWFFDEWRDLYGHETRASVQRRIESWLTRGQIPTAFVAVSEGQVVGTVALKQRELREFDCSPWLAGLFVLKEHRRKGIGTLLVSTAENEAASLGIERLYLYTPDSEEFYERLGWSVTHRNQLLGGSVAVMSKWLRGP